MESVTCNFEFQKDFDELAKKQITLVKIDCQKCQFYDPHQKVGYPGTECFKNLINLFKSHSDLSECIIKTVTGKYKLPDNQTKYLIDYVQQLIKIPSNRQTSYFNRRTDCAKGRECESKYDFSMNYILGSQFNYGLIGLDPIDAYREIGQKIKIHSRKPTQDSKCQKCYEPFLRFLTEIYRLLEKSAIIKSYLNLNNKKKTLAEIKSIIFGNITTISPPITPAPNFSGSEAKTCTTYKNGPYKIIIIKNLTSKKYFYEIATILDDPDLKQIFTRVTQQIRENPTDFGDKKRIFKLEEYFRYEKQLVDQLLRTDYGSLPEGNISDLTDLIVFEVINLNPLMALLTDDEIEEIFLDSPDSTVYLDHRQYGRCLTSLSLTPTEIESLLTRLRIEAEERLDETHPFLKTEVVTQYFHIRASVETAPLYGRQLTLNLRKLHKKVLTLPDLIGNKTLSAEAAAYLLFSWLHGRCILVIGEPYSGKTTLINSLDLLGRDNWRKIYIEDVKESIDQSQLGVHQIPYQVEESGEVTEKYSTKSSQVKQSLHRTPDAIYIGELIHTPSVEAFFFLLKVGLRRCLATAHGESPELMVQRFTSKDKIDPMEIGNIDIIVQMIRDYVKDLPIRRVTRITEVQKEDGKLPIAAAYGSSNVKFVDIFTRDSKEDQLINSYKTLNEVYRNSLIIKKINSLRRKYISESRFTDEVLQIQATLEKLRVDNRKNLQYIITTFHELWREVEIN